MPTIYGIIERNGVNFSHDSAVSISYDNSNSGLTSTEVQSAIDELKLSIPTGLDDLSDDATHRLVTDTEKNTWNGKQDTLTEGSNISIVNNTISATDHIYNTVTTATDGLCPSLPGTSTKFLRGDGQWNVPTGTVYTTATTAADGLLPTLSGTTSSYLRGDGVWYNPISSLEQRVSQLESTIRTLNGE